MDAKGDGVAANQDEASHGSGQVDASEAATTITSEGGSADGEDGMPGASAAPGGPGGQRGGPGRHAGEETTGRRILRWVAAPFVLIGAVLRFVFVGRKGQTSRPLWVEIPMLVVVALVLTLIVKTFFVQAFYIPSGSMETTITPNDRVLVDKLSPWFDSKPARGDVVVFHDPGNWLLGEPAPQGNVFTDVLTFVGIMPSSSERDLIKRVIGLPGDHVACCDDQGRITVNGKPLDNGGYVYLSGGPPPAAEDRRQSGCPASIPATTPLAAQRCFSITVPPGEYWVQGDNRYNSCDSVCHLSTPGITPFVPESDIVGHALVVVWPLDRIRTLPVPGTFDQDFALAASSPATPPTLALLAGVPLTLSRRRRRAEGPAAGGVCGPGSARAQERLLRRAMR